MGALRRVDRPPHTRGEGMRVLALGGAGGMGRRAVETASGFDFIDELVVADLKLDRAERVAERCGVRARAARIDIQDERALAELLYPADVVLNTVGPYYRFGVPILRAAIAAGTHYLDINDDWEPTLDMLELDAEARAADVTAVIGLGASPGISNLLAVRAAAQLDRVESLTTGWGLGGGGDSSVDMDLDGELGSGPNAAMVHWMHQISGSIRQLHAGEWVEVKPIEEIEIDFPDLGTGTAWTVGHPEAVTLPRSFPGLRDCRNVMVMPRWLIAILRQLAAEIDAGRLDAESAAKLLQTGSAPSEASSAGAEPRSGSSEPRSGSSEPRSGSSEPPVLPPIFAFAEGTRGGKPARAGSFVTAAPSGGMAGVTGVPLALGLEMFARGTIERRGVLTPEAAIDPDAFFDALAPHCTPPVASGGELVSTHTSG
jgi:saccharopine dehydrogenase-like NADP-dependent oxidoreductase